jgi:hypothetical protein
MTIQQNLASFTLAAALAALAPAFVGDRSPVGAAAAVAIDADDIGGIVTVRADPRPASG